MALIVQKYGGSSLADAEKIKSVAQRIARTADADNKVVAVVSAMGDTTDDLIALSQQVSKNPEPREMDVLLSTGELVSCTLMAMTLRSMGHKAISLSGAQAGIRTDSSHGQAQIADMAPDRLIQELDNDTIVIVAGFQGITEDLDITTLGRGGSDTTAVALAAALGAARCEVYTDVEGIYTADPRLVPAAHKLDEISFEEMLELASLGAKVLQIRAVEFAGKYKVPLRVLSSFEEGPGTLISLEEDTDMETPAIAGIAFERDEAKLTVAGVPDVPGIAYEVIGPVSEAGIEVDVIVQNAAVDGTNDITFTVKRSEGERAKTIIDAVASKLKAVSVVLDKKVGKVSLVGVGMRSHAGIAAKMFKVLADESINIQLITTSEIKISIVIEEKYLELAVRALHSEFELGDPNYEKPSS